MRYVAGINHEARGRAAPEDRVIYSGNVPNGGVTLLIYVMAKDGKFSFYPQKNRFVTRIR